MRGRESRAVQPLFPDPSPASTGEREASRTASWEFRKGRCITLRFEGDQELTPPPPELWAKLSDARFLVRCVPGIETVTQQEANRAAFVLRPGLSFARGTLQVTMQVTEAVPGQSAKYLLHSKGIGSTSDVEASLAILPRDTGSRVHWIAEIRELGGLLKAVPGGLIQAAAKKVVSDAWAAVENQLRQETAPPTAE